MVDSHSNFGFYRIAFAVVLSLLFTGCRRDLGIPTIENELLLPILSTKLTISEIVPDSLRKEDPDGLVSLVYRNSIYSATLSSFDELATREFEEVPKLQSLTLNPRSAERAVSLGTVAQEMGATGQFIIDQNGSNSPIPPISGLSYGPLPVDGSEFFETVTLDSGYMDVTIDNGFPTGLSNIDFEIRNESDNSLVGSQNFTSVSAGGSETKTIDLAGKTIEGSLLGNILNFDIDGSASPVPIDTSDQILVTITVRDMKVNSATAIFPAQNIIELGDTSTLENVQDLRITQAKAKTGIINIRVVSTVEDTMYFNYFIPDGTKDGQPFSISEKVLPAPVGGSIEKSFSYSVDGYDFDLTGQPAVNSYNAFYSELTGRIDSTGKVVNLSLNDSILIYVQLSEFIPEYVEGYLGNSEASIGPESAPVELFKHFESGSIEFEEVKVALGVVNGNGVPFEVELNELSAENTQSGEQVDFDLGDIPNPLQIEEASDLSTAWEGQWKLEASEELNAALNIYPDQLNVALRVASNPAFDTNDLTQFAVDTNDLEAFLDIEIPLTFIASDLVLADTLAFVGINVSNIEMVETGVFYLVASNELPLDANLWMEFIDPQGDLMQLFEFDGLIEGQSLSNQSVIALPFSKDDLEAINTADRVVVKARVNTSSSTEPSKIYSDQALGVTITARLSTELSP